MTQVHPETSSERLFMAANLRAGLRPAAQLMREIAAWGQMSRAQLAGLRMGQGRAVAFLPARGPDNGSSALRIYAMAAALKIRGWRVLVLPWKLTLAQRHRLLGLFGPDIVVMQGARHDLNRPALYPHWPIVYDMDDADFHLPHLAGPVQAAMGQVAAVVAGASYIANWCLGAGAGHAEVIWTTTAVSKRTHVPQASRPAVVAWAQSRPMDYQREAALVRDVMAQVAQRHADVRLRLYDRQPGDDPGFLQGFKQVGIQTEWVKKSIYRDYLVSFDDVAVGLAPLCPETPFSRGKSFGKVLAYLDRQCCVVGSEAGEHGAFFTPETGVISNEPTHWVAQICALLEDPARRSRMAGAAHAQFQACLTPPVSAGRLDRLLHEVLAHTRGLTTG